MGAADSVIRYQLGIVHRWAPAAVGPVALALWSYVIVRDGDLWLLPLALALSIVLSLFALAGTVPRRVTVGPDALVVRTLRGTVSLDWADICHVEQRVDAVWVMARSGWYLLPLASGVTPIAPAVARPLGEAVWVTWIDQRGSDWRPHELDPWTPTTDARGRTTLRAPLESRQWFFVGIGSALGLTLVPNRPSGTLIPALVASGVLVAIEIVVAGLHHWWSRVTIDGTGLTIRSLGRTRHVEWWQVDGFRETLGFAGRWHHLTLDYVEASDPGDLAAVVRDGRIVRFRESVTLPGPSTWARWWANDPEFLAIWAWLNDQVIAAREQGTAAVAVADGSTARSTVRS